MSGDAADRERALKVRAAIAQGATITQHRGGIIAMSVPGREGTLITSGDELRKIIPGWPRADEGHVIGRAR
jgi:hypothetical protein